METLLDRMDNVPFMLPAAIMLLRFTDVSIGTVRIVMVFRGRRLTAAILGFFEITIWLTAIAGIISHLDNWFNIIAYGLGFAMGNAMGMMIENKMAIGQQVVRFISREEGDKITRTLRGMGFGVTEVLGSGREGPVGLGFVIASRKLAPQAVGIISQVDPGSVVTIEDVRHSNIVEYQQRHGKSLRWWSGLKKK